MASLYLQLNNTVLQWVLEQAQSLMAPDEIVERLSDWIAGRKKPTFSQVENMSRKIHIPFGYFFLDKPPVEDNKIAEFRTINSTSFENPSRDLIDTVNAMSDIQDWMADYNIRNGNDPYNYVGKYEGQKVTAEQLNDDILHTLDLKEGWSLDFRNADESFKTLRSAMSVAGIIVMMNGIVGNNTHRKLNINEFRAFTLINEYAPLIFINNTDSKNAKVFSLLHEICHIWLGSESLYNRPENNANYRVNQTEQLCNQVAAEMLVPMTKFRIIWDEDTGSLSQRVKSVADRFNCSQYVIARRAYDAGIMDRADFERINSQLGRSINDSRTTGSGGNYYTTLQSRLDHRFVKSLDASVSRGETLYTDAYHLTNTNGSTYTRLISAIGG